jgi:hypothetical protein
MNWRFWQKKTPEPEPERAPIPQARPVDPPAAPVAASRAQRAVPRQAQRAVRRKTIPTYVLADKFVRWMQSQEGGTGYWLVEEIDQWREVFCDKFGYTVPRPVEFRSCLAVARYVSKGVYRLNSWEFLDVQKRTSMERPTLYKIHRKSVSDTISNDFSAETTIARQDDVDYPSVALRIRPNAGKRVAKKRQAPSSAVKAVLEKQEIVAASVEIEAREAA